MKNLKIVTIFSIFLCFIVLFSLITSAKNLLSSNFIRKSQYSYGIVVLPSISVNVPSFLNVKNIIRNNPWLDELKLTNIQLHTLAEVDKRYLQDNFAILPVDYLFILEPISQDYSQILLHLYSYANKSYAGNFYINYIDSFILTKILDNMKNIIDSVNSNVEYSNQLKVYQLLFQEFFDSNSKPIFLFLKQSLNEFISLRLFLFYMHNDKVMGYIENKMRNQTKDENYDVSKEISTLYLVCQKISFTIKTLNLYSSMHYLSVDVAYITYDDIKSAIGYLLKFRRIDNEVEYLSLLLFID